MEKWLEAVRLNAKPHAKLVAQLKAVGIDPRKMDVKGRTALHIAANYGRGAIVKLLLEKSIPSDPTIASALHFAAKAGHCEVVAQLAAAGPAVLAKTGVETLRVAAISGHADVVKQMLELMPSLIHAVDEEGWTPLHHAVDVGHESRAELLLTIEPKLIEAITRRGDTVLHRAVSAYCSERFIERLWHKHELALRHVNGGEFETPFYLAIRYQREDIICLFRPAISLDEAVAANRAVCSYFAGSTPNYAEQLFRPVMEPLCEPLLGRDVMNIMLTYLGLDCPRVAV